LGLNGVASTRKPTPAFLFASALLSTLYCTAVDSAEITYQCSEEYRECSILLRGDIVEGDAQRLREVLQEINRRDFLAWKLYLMSNGGLISEALEIGRLTRSLLIWTVSPSLSVEILFDTDGMTDEQVLARCPQECVRHFYLGVPGVDAFTSKRRTLRYTFDSNTLCASACALIALAGVGRSGTIGLHHVFLRDDQLSFDQFENYVIGGVNSVREYLDDMRIPSSIMESMFYTPSDQVAWIDLSDHEYDAVFYEFLGSRCDLLSRDLVDTLDRLWFIDMLGSYIDESGVWVVATLSNDERQFLAELTRRREADLSCIITVSQNAAREAQSLLLR
jgi:hypothetical protein